jgi:hypothetical protein
VECDGHAGWNTISVVGPVHADNLALANDLASHPLPIVDRGEF